MNEKIINLNKAAKEKEVAQEREIAKREIWDKLWETKTDFSELAEVNMDFFLESWNNCDCEHTPINRESGDKMGKIFLVWKHIYDCLKTKEEIENFKNEFIKIADQAKVSLGNFREETIKRIKNFAQENLGGTAIHEWNWEENLRSEWIDSREKINLFYDEFIFSVQPLLNKTVKDSEEVRKIVEKFQAEDQRQMQRTIEQSEFNRLSFLLLTTGCPDLATLEKNYQIVKNSPLYSASRNTFADFYENNKTQLDHLYNTTKLCLQSQQHQENNGSNQTRENTNTTDQRSAICEEIMAKLADKPFIFDNELDSALWSTYTNWINKIHNIEISQLESFKNKMLAAIAQIRTKKQQEKLNNVFTESQNQTGVKLEETINQVDQQRGSQNYADNKEKVEELKRRKATENLEDYRQKSQKKIEENMKRNGISEQNFANEEARKTWISLKKGEIKDSTQIVKAEMLIVDETEKAGASKKLTDLLNQVHQALNEGNKEKIEKLKNQLSKFLKNPNVYYQYACQNMPEAKSLLSQLENYFTSQKSTASPQKFPWKTVWPIIVILLIFGVGLVLFTISQRKNFNQNKTKKIKNGNI